jgi:hypothetical protein
MHSRHEGRTHPLGPVLGHVTERGQKLHFCDQGFFDFCAQETLPAVTPAAACVRPQVWAACTSVDAYKGVAARAP